MSKLRGLARNRECQVRIPGTCNRDPLTTVLAHLAGGGLAMKRHDLHGAWCCSACHDAIDGRVKSDWDKTTLKLWHLEGVIRTQEILISEGKL